MAGSFFSHDMAGQFWEITGFASYAMLLHFCL